MNKSDPDLPNYEDVIAIYDAKYSESPSLKSFQEGQMSLFSRMIRLLEQKQPNFIGFTGNCLITNKESYTNDKVELAEELITVVELFDELKIFRVI